MLLFVVWLWRLCSWGARGIQTPRGLRRKTMSKLIFVVALAVAIAATALLPVMGGHSPNFRTSVHADGEGGD
jgi:hypothetical protein